ncbi:hypothetical protein [Devosia sp. 2618]|uniref:DUF6950 family protein n=1 Tax=Devosia sp. 2618 TaxID=3156454 RepID=UPI00339822C9
MAETRFEIAARIIEQEMAKPYTPGSADCFFFGLQTADALDSSLGLVTRYAKAYRTLAGAQRALRRLGYTSLVALFSTHFEQCAPAMARVGDLAVILLTDGEHVGICVGQKFITKTARGQSFHDMPSILAAFHVG